MGPRRPRPAPDLPIFTQPVRRLLRATFAPQVIRSYVEFVMCGACFLKDLRRRGKRAAESTQPTETELPEAGAAGEAVKEASRQGEHAVATESAENELPGAAAAGEAEPQALRPLPQLRSRRRPPRALPPVGTAAGESLP